MTLEIGLQKYEPKWNSESGRCLDMDNSELKSKYGESAKLLCCDHLFSKRQALLQHFKSQKHKRDCIQVMTDLYKKELPSDLSNDETIVFQCREIRGLKATFAKKCQENEKNKWKIIEQNIKMEELSTELFKKK